MERSIAARLFSTDPTFLWNVDITTRVFSNRHTFLQGDHTAVVLSWWLERLRRRLKHYLFSSIPTHSPVPGERLIGRTEI
jgi:hypothetical protein